MFTSDYTTIKNCFVIFTIENYINQTTNAITIANNLRKFLIYKPDEASHDGVGNTFAIATDVRASRRCWIRRRRRWMNEPAVEQTTAAMDEVGEETIRRGNRRDRYAV